MEGTGMGQTTSDQARRAARALVLPLALAQFVASYAASNMNVAISQIAEDLDTTVIGLQTTITLFTLTMAALMIPGSKLTDIWGRKRCFVIGLVVYGTGATLALLAQGLPLLMVGYSLLEGVGSALLIPPIYILVTVSFDDLRTRARYFGVVSGAAGLGAAAGPLIGGLITSAISWRASFLAQVLLVAWIILLARKITESRPATRPSFDMVGAVLSAVGLLLVVTGFLSTSTYGWGASRADFSVGGTVLIPTGSPALVWYLLALGSLFFVAFYLHVRSAEKEGRDPLLHTRLFRNRTANLGLGTQLVQWLTLQGTFFVVSVFLQQIRGYSPIQTGLMLSPATAGILLSAAGAERFARRRSQRWLIVAGFLVTSIGMVLLLLLAREDSGILSFVPGLLLIGVGVGAMLTSSVNVVQSAFPEHDQGDISGLSRSVSNLGSSLGTALAGSVLVASTVPGGVPFALALGTMLAIALLGLLVAYLLPRAPVPAPVETPV
jgi:MFS family permease